MSGSVAYTGDQDLNRMIEAALRRADPELMIAKALSIQAEELTLRTESTELSIHLGAFDRILLLGLGKASARMARAMEAKLGDRIAGGVVVTKHGHGEPLERAELFEAGHPVPDEAGVRGARRMEELLETVDERTLCFTVVSGGGSALLVSPYRDAERELTLQEIQETTRLLLSCGAAIQEINCIRKHLSNVKGGRFARMLHPARSVNLILSDVIGDDPASIASGITAPDPTTYTEALEIARWYGILDSLPKRVREVIELGAAGKIPETPGPGDPVFERVQNVVIGSNSQALMAAAATARELGYETAPLTSRLAGEAREVGKLFPALARDIREKRMLLAPPACVLAGGETTVTLREGHGKGGRNQELALTVLREMVRAPEAFSGVSFASVGTDGNDGPTDSAGAWITGTIVEKAKADPEGVEQALRNNDAYPYLQSLGAHIMTGPTNTNVCDLQLLLIR
ncbi:MAG: glycerate kinase type-2 family protein [Alkalispirochaetaceae bacterium]